MNIFFISIFFLLFILSKRITRSLYNPFFLVMGPYAFIVSFNNFVAVRYGFYEISDLAIFYLLFGMLLFFIGFLLAEIYSAFLIPNLKRFSTQKSFIFNYNLNAINLFVLVSAVLLLFRILIIFLRYGGEHLVEAEVLSSGFFGHLSVIAIVFVPILLDAGLRTAKKRFFIAVALLLLSTFFSFTKYHVIFPIIYIFIYLTIEYRVNFFKPLFFASIIIVTLFFLNYVVSFFIKGRYAEMSFLLNHIWKYIAGGTINFNLFVHNPIFEYNSVDFLFVSITPIMNMILQKLGFPVFTANKPPFLESFPEVSSIGGGSNVLCTVGLIYGDGNIFWFTFFMILQGFLLSFFWKLATKTRSASIKLFGCVVMAFSTLSFFANYWGLSRSWLTVFWALLLPLFFIKKKKTIVFTKQAPS